MQAVYNRSNSQRIQDLISIGAVSYDSPRQVAEKSDIIFTMVGYPKDVEEVILG